jgi:hypothetical protein
MDWQNIPNITVRVVMHKPMKVFEGETAERFKQRVWDVMNGFNS